MSPEGLLFVLLVLYTGVGTVSYGVIRQTIAIPRLHLPMSAVWPVSVMFLLVIAVGVSIYRFLVGWGDRVGIRLANTIVG